MSNNDIKQIRINNKPIGVAGLDATMTALAADYARKSDNEIGVEMLKRLEVANYVPQGARDLYKRAFVREFRSFLGQPTEEAVYEGLHIVILGPGCALCDRMEMDVRDVMTEMELAAALDHITDPKEIVRYGVMGVPALIVNGKVVCVGQAPNRKKIRQWLEEALKKT